MVGVSDVKNRTLTKMPFPFLTIIACYLEQLVDFFAETDDFARNAEVCQLEL